MKKTSRLVVRGAGLVALYQLGTRGNLSQILHQYLCIAGVAELRDALFAYLTHALTGQAKLVANLFETFLVASNAEALADNGYLALLEHLVEH